MDGETRQMTIQILGRTLEHLGVQMYKRRDTAIAELVANSWDAGARTVQVDVPEEDRYSRETSTIRITDDGHGMTADEVQSDYLVVGRNRRASGSNSVVVPDPRDPSASADNDDSNHGKGRAEERPVMGRKGIGKLAGFGISTSMQVVTWRDQQATKFELNANELKREAGSVAEVQINARLGAPPSDIKSAHGTRIVLSTLKHSTPLSHDNLRESLARRFSRTVRGRMRVFVNGVEVAEPDLELTYREPEGSGTTEVGIRDGQIVRWWAGFSRTVLPSSQLRGFTVQVRGKTAQAPPYFFNVEGTASGQHGTKYLTGVIEADFLDTGTDDESDLISTDRQEIDWEDERTSALHQWGGKLTRRLLLKRSERRGKEAEQRVLDDPDLRARIQQLDDPSQRQALNFVRKLMGASDVEEARTRDLADTIVRAFEYRHFHDFIAEFDVLSEDPDQFEHLLGHLSQWKVLESRAILEVVKGRLDIVHKFHDMIVNNAPETARPVGTDNLHDLLADYPWLINPDWQVLSEERTLTKQLREWGTEDIDANDRQRYDFLALSREAMFVVIEIKRAGHAVTLKDLHQIENYAGRLLKARSNVRMAFISGGTYDVPDAVLQKWHDRDDIELLTWSSIYERARAYYEHYRSVLEGEVHEPSFTRLGRQVTRTRAIVSGAAYRTPDQRKAGIGPQDIAITAGNEGGSRPAG